MRSSNSNLALGLLGGLAAGAVLGILLAPDKGSSTRKKLIDKGHDYADGLKSKYDSLLGAVSKKYENLYQDGESMLADGKSKFNDLKSEGKSGLETAKKEFSNMKA